MSQKYVNLLTYSRQLEDDFKVCLTWKNKKVIEHKLNDRNLKDGRFDFNFESNVW